MRLQQTPFILSLLLASGHVFAGRTSYSPKVINFSSAGSTSVGAVYLLTNEPSGNFIVAADICSNGTLNLRSATYAGGDGAHGLSATGDPPSPDALFSQGALQASKAGNILVAVNAGSNTVSLFSIDPNDPTALQMIGKPASSGGDFPISVAINKSGTMACTLNGGAINGVSCFSIDMSRGLVPIQNTVCSLNLNQTTPATGPPGSASQIIFTEDEKSLVVSVKGVPPQPGFYAMWDVQDDGSLSQDFQSIYPAKGGLLPFSMTLIPGENAILSTDPGIGFDIVDLAAIGTTQDKDLSSANAIKGQELTCWSAFSPNTGNFFLSDTGTSTITEVHVDDCLTGTVVKQYPQADQSALLDLDVASVGTQDYLYVLASNVTAVEVLSLDGSGSATNIQQLDLYGPTYEAGLPISANNLLGITTFVKG